MGSDYTTTVPRTCSIFVSFDCISNAGNRTHTRQKQYQHYRMFIIKTVKHTDMDNISTIITITSILMV